MFQINQFSIEVRAPPCFSLVNQTFPGAVQQIMEGTAGETAVLTFVVSNARRIDSKTIFALVDVEVQFGGVSFLIQGVQARRRLAQAGTSIHLPTFKDLDGRPKAAIVLPDEVREPLADAVLAFLVEEGLARPRYGGCA